MAKIYKGKVSVFQIDNQLVVKQDVKGKFSYVNVAELYKCLTNLGEVHKLEVRLYKTEQLANSPVLLSDKWGKPYLALVREYKAPGELVVIKTAAVQKLA
jgi:hypothetical protein